MRTYKTERVGKLLNDKKKDLGVMKLLEQHRKLNEILQTIPDETLKRVDFDAIITNDGTLIFECSSSVTLNYLRRQRNLIERHLEEFISEEEIASFVIRLRSD